ncbi:aluminum-activated malate transporter 13-like [Rhododendron vialii]|uniref:aluminum-activated malate transporter 13-like n=1 Tax=Rhododendron vialii TaxID=182163 RepID=UPI00265DFA95|nr:aluminum-activated malate transporter 13-like [Rhododendron vialii]
MSSTVITIPNEDGISPNQKKKSQFAQFALSFSVSSLIAKQSKYDKRKVLHSIKVGIALVLVSLLYLLDPMYEEVGDNAMWAIMTVVVIFEFTAGATLGKGLLRGTGTLLGGGLGCLVAILADEFDRIGNNIVVGTSVFLFGAAVTYCRLVPSIKRRYDYGAMIFILTFNLVVVSGFRPDNKIIELARERLSTIGMGFAICILTSLFIFPNWASDELHYSMSSKFEKLGICIEGCLEEYFTQDNEKETQAKAYFADCRSVLYSKSNDDSLANFARWEPWHGKFGLSYPWDKYLQIGDVLRELSAIIISLRGCLQSPRQPSTTTRHSIMEPCKTVGLHLAWTLGELGESIKKMERCPPKALVASKLQSMKLELSLIASPSKLGAVDNGEGLAMASFVFLLMEILEKVEELAKEVDELGELAGFQTK